MKYDDNFDDRRKLAPDQDDDDAIFEFLERRSRRREYEEFIEKYSGRDDNGGEYIGSRESSAARQVLSEGRVSGNARSGSYSGSAGRSSGTRSTQASSGSARSRSGSSSRSQTGYGTRSGSAARGQTSSARYRDEGTTARNGSKWYTDSYNRYEYNENSGRSGRKTSSRNSVGTIVKRLVLAAFLLTAAFFIGYYTLMDVLTADINRVEINTGTAVTAAEAVAGIDVRSNTGYVKNVLLLGIDDNGESGSRSDTIMIASVDTRSGTVKLCSILRDNYVAIPGHDNNRINAAYAFGGPELTLQTIEANFRVHIDDYVSVDMDAMRQIVDAIGGVTITITEAEARQINRYSWSQNPDVSAGEMLLDGKQAVCYAQIRKIDSDFGRTNRQRVLISAIVAKCKTLSIGDLTGLIKTVSPYLTTNMSSAEIATLGLKILPALGGEFGQMSIPADGTYSSKQIRGMDVLVSDLEENTLLLHEFLYG